MYSQLLEFIQFNSDKVVVDAARRIVLRFKKVVRELQPEQFPSMSAAVSYSIIYKGEKTDYKNIQDFISSFGKDNTHLVNDSVEINVQIKKDKITDNKYENFYFFKDYQGFFKAIKNLELKKENKKMVILILSEERLFNSNFLSVINLKKKKQEISTDIDRIAYNKYITLNSLYKDKKLKNYLYYPATWISAEDNKCVDYHFYGQTLNSFFSIISNAVLPDNQYVIRGYKTIYFSNDHENDFSSESCKVIDELMDFLIDEQRNHDKLLLLRNTMSLFLSSNETVAGLEKNIYEIKKNVEFNFNAYIQNKVELFLDQKNKLLQEYISTTKKVEDMTSNLVSQIRTIMLSLLGTVFLTLLGEVKSAETKVMLNFVLLSFTFYFCINWFLVFRQKEQKDILLNNLEVYTKEIGTIDGNTDSSFSYKNLRERYLEQTEKTYLKYRLWTLIGLSILIVFFMMIYISNRFYVFHFVKAIVKFIVGY